MRCIFSGEIKEATCEGDDVNCAQLNLIVEPRKPFDGTWLKLSVPVLPDSKFGARWDLVGKTVAVHIEH